MIGTEYRMLLQRAEPEPSWLKRVVLRRRFRWYTIACQIPTDFSFSRNLNGPDSHLVCMVQGADAVELMERIRV